MKRKFISLVLVLSMLLSLVAPSSATSIDEKTPNTLLYTQTAVYEGQEYIFELYSDGTSLIYTVDGENESRLQFAADGTATATVGEDGQLENFALDIENLNSENVNFDVYSATETDVDQCSPYSSDLDLITHIDSFDQLEAIATGKVRPRAFAVAVYSLLALAFVAVTLVYASRYINGEKFDYLALVIEAIRAIEDSLSPIKYFNAIHLSRDADVLINFANPIGFNAAVNRVRQNLDVYTFLSGNALSVAASAVSHSGTLRYAGPEINQNRTDGFIYYYHYHTLRGVTHLSHIWFGFPYTR